MHMLPLWNFNDGKNSFVLNIIIKQLNKSKLLIKK